MKKMYAVYLAGEVVGQVQVTREGLYLHVCCRCRLTGESVCRLVAVCGNRQENLGVLVPFGEYFDLETRIPSKRLDSGEFNFYIEPNKAIVKGRFVPISPEEPFAYLTRLKDAYMTCRDGQVGVMIQEKAGT